MPRTVAAADFMSVLAVIVTGPPALRPRTTPEALTVAIVVSRLDHLKTAPGTTPPSRLYAVAVSCCVASTRTVAGLGVTTTETMTRAAGLPPLAAYAASDPGTKPGGSPESGEQAAARSASDTAAASRVAAAPALGATRSDRCSIMGG